MRSITHTNNQQNRRSNTFTCDNGQSRSISPIAREDPQQNQNQHSQSQFIFLEHELIAKVARLELIESQQKERIDTLNVSNSELKQQVEFWKEELN